MKIRIAGTVRNSIVDGPGIRYVIFAQGCRFNCPNCHNTHTHDFNGGELTDTETLASEIKKDPLLDGATFSGGEPFEQAKAFADLAEKISDKHIMCYSGYTFEELIASTDPDKKRLLNKIDVLVDGRYLDEKRSLDLKFRGSANQRILDLKESVKCGAPVEIDF